MYCALHIHFLLDCLHCPLVQVESWSELPIDPALREALSKKETEQQLAVWEFIATEHSHIRRLETIINVRSGRSGWGWRWLFSEAMYI